MLKLKPRQSVTFFLMKLPKQFQNCMFVAKETAMWSSGFQYGGFYYLIFSLIPILNYVKKIYIKVTQVFCLHWEEKKIIIKNLLAPSLPVGSLDPESTVPLVLCHSVQMYMGSLMTGC